MNTVEIIDQYKNCVIQIATPYSTGTGFYLSDYNVIVTNEHVVRDNKEVVINGENIEKQIVDVIYLDENFDLAFLSCNNCKNLTGIKLSSNVDLHNGQEVIAVGHPFGLEYTATKGILSNTKHDISGIHYLQHDAALTPGNSGGPLISTSGEIIGVNTFVIKNGSNIGFSLPAEQLKIALDEFNSGNDAKGVRCTSCRKIVFEQESNSKYCNYCGAQNNLISNIETYEAIGVNRNIEKMLSDLGYDVPLTRMGPSHWTINRGSAKINIAYHEKSGLITGDAYLGSLPEEKIAEIYSYLLEQNYKIEGLSFSVKGNDIILSLLIFDHYLNQETAQDLFDHLAETADLHDNILVEQYGANWL